MCSAIMVSSASRAISRASPSLSPCETPQPKSGNVITNPPSSAASNNAGYSITLPLYAEFLKKSRVCTRVVRTRLDLLGRVTGHQRALALAVDGEVLRAFLERASELRRLPLQFARCHT